MQQLKKRLDIKTLLDIAEQNGLTDAEICNATKSDRTTLWRWRTGKCKPHRNKLIKLLGVINA